MIKKLELYLIKFDKITKIIAKIYFFDCKIRENKCQFVIVNI